MFNKNDPLVDNIKKIMEQNERARQIEQKLCEELGIISRKQLPNEHLANYDALLQQRLAEEKSTMRVPSSAPYGNLDAAKKAMEKQETAKDEKIEEAEGSTPRNPKEASLAKKYGNPNKITHGDVLKARGVIEEDQLDEVSSKVYKSAMMKATQKYLNAKTVGKKAEADKRVTQAKKFQKAGIEAEKNEKMQKEDVQQDSKNPVPTTVKDRLDNKLGTGTKSTYTGSNSNEAPSKSDRDELDAKVKSLNENPVALASRVVAPLVSRGAAAISRYMSGASNMTKGATGVDIASRTASVASGIEGSQRGDRLDTVNGIAGVVHPGLGALTTGADIAGKLAAKKFGTDGASDKDSEEKKSDKKKTETAEMNEAFDAVMEEIRRNLGEEAFASLMEDPGQPVVRRGSLAAAVKKEKQAFDSDPANRQALSDRDDREIQDRSPLQAKNRETPARPPMADLSGGSDIAGGGATGGRPAPEVAAPKPATTPRPASGGSTPGSANAAPAPKPAATPAPAPKQSEVSASAQAKVPDRRLDTRAPVSPVKGDGKTGVALANLGVSRDDRRSDTFVKSTLGQDFKAKAGSAEANLALQKHFADKKATVDAAEKGKAAPAPAATPAPKADAAPVADKAAERKAAENQASDFQGPDYKPAAKEDDKKKTKEAGVVDNSNMAESKSTFNSAIMKILSEGRK